MFKHPVTRWIVGVVVAIALLGLLRFKPWRQGGGPIATRDQLQVGFLPVT
jgi:hypothetical protein